MTVSAFSILFFSMTALFTPLSSDGAEDPCSSSFRKDSLFPLAFESVDPLSGEYCLSKTDIEIVGAEPLFLKRCYRSGQSGGWSFFPPLKRPQSDPHLKEKRLLNGNRLFCEYDEADRLVRLYTTAPDPGKIYAVALFHYLDGEEGSFDVETSDNRVLAYRSEKTREGDFLLSEIGAKESVKEKIFYDPLQEKRSPLLSSYDLTGGRGRRVAYDHKRYLAYEKRELKKNPFYHRVIALQEPVGNDGSWIATKRFSYESNENGAITEVRDAYGNLTKYFYTPRRLLQSVEYYQNREGVQRLCYTEKFIFGKEEESSPRLKRLCEAAFRKCGCQIGMNLSGRVNLTLPSKLLPALQLPSRNSVVANCTHSSLPLLGKILSDNEGREIFSWQFFYDERGNRIEERVSGRLSGEKEGFVFETFSTLFSFEESTSFLKEERDEEGRSFSYLYLPGTDRLLAKFFSFQNTIKIRHFYEYDADHILIREIVDDGRSLDKEELLGVTQRTVRTFTPRQEQPFLHLPETITESYLDLKTKEEVMLQKRRLTYSDRGKVGCEEVYDANGIRRYTLHKEYDSWGRLTKETNALGQEACYEWDIFGNLIKEKDFSGRLTTKRIYDSSNRLVREEKSGDDGLLHETLHFYDFLHNKTGTSDSFGNEFSLVRDCFGDQAESRLSPVFSPSGEPEVLMKRREDDGTEGRCIYDKRGNLKKKVFQDGSYLLYINDEQERITVKELYASSGEKLSEELFHYNAFHLLSKTDAEGGVITYEYDGAGRKSAEEEGKRRVEFSYDELGRMTSVRTSAGEHTLVVFKQYDLLDRLMEERTEEGKGRVLNKTCYAYDASGNRNAITRFIDGRAATERFFYDSLGRLTEKIDPEGGLTRITYEESYYNASGQKVLQETITDPSGCKIIKRGDALGRLASLQKVDAQGTLLSVEEFFYQGKERLSCQRTTLYTPQGSRTQERTFTWDVLGRLAAVVESPRTPEQKAVRYFYTPKGRLHQLFKPDGVVLTYTYNALDQLTHLASSDGTICYTFLYDRLGRLLLACDLLTEQCVVRSYDLMGNLIEESLPNGTTVKNCYDSFGHRTKLVLPDHSSISYHYADPLHLSKVTRYGKESQPLYTHSFTAFDLSGNLLSEQLIGTLGEAIYNYDLCGRILSQRLGSFLIQRVVYDSMSNPVRSSLTTPFCESMTCDNEDLLSRQFPNKEANERYSCDPCGKVIRLDALSLSYDALNRLIEATHPENFRLVFTYDALSRRLSKRCFAWKEKRWELFSCQAFFYDDLTEIGSCNAEGAIRDLCLFAPSSHSSFPSALAVELENIPYAPIQDLCGNLISLISLETKAPVTGSLFSPSGEEYRFSLSTLRAPWGFCMGRTDFETGFVYGRAGYYSPALGRRLAESFSVLSQKTRSPLR